MNRRGTEGWREGKAEVGALGGESARRQALLASHGLSKQQMGNRPSLRSLPLQLTQPLAPDALALPSFSPCWVRRRLCLGSLRPRSHTPGGRGRSQIPVGVGP